MSPRESMQQGRVVDRCAQLVKLQRRAPYEHARTFDGILSRATARKCLRPCVQAFRKIHQQGRVPLLISMEVVGAQSH